MHPWILNAAYAGTLAAVSPYFAVQALRTGKYRRGWPAKLLGDVPIRPEDRPCAWFHAVSVGEVNVLGTFIPAFRGRFPDWDVVVSTTTDTGKQVAEARFPDLATFYCPLDFSWAVEKAMNRIRPSLFVLTELEVWPNLLRAAKATGARTALINGRLSERSHRGYQRLQSLTGEVLRDVDYLAVQDESYAERFRSLCRGERVQATGSIKFDGAETNRSNPRTLALRRLAGLAAADRVFLAGSTSGDEERIVLEAVASVRAGGKAFRAILAPRHPERGEEVAELLQRSGLRWARRSDLAEGGTAPPWDVLLVDVVGELAAWWGAADVGFVGGSIHPRGGQNMIEPAAYGVATCFGPRTRNFRDVVGQLLEADAAVVVEDEQELAAFLARCLQQDEYREQLGDAGRKVVAQNLGATSRTLDGLEKLIATPTSSAAA